MGRDIESSLAWPLASEAWRAPAEAARAVAEPSARLARAVVALRAELADLADLEARWQIEELDPLGAPIGASRQPATQQEGPARAISPERRARFAPADGDRTGDRQRPEEMPSLARSLAWSESPGGTLTRGETPSPPSADRFGSVLAERRTTTTTVPLDTQEVDGTARRQPANLDDTTLIAAARRTIGGISAPKDLLERWAGLASEAGPPEAAPAAPSPSRHLTQPGSDPARRRTLPRSGEDLPGQSLAAAREKAPSTADPAQRRGRTIGSLIPAAARVQREEAINDPPSATAARRSLVQAGEGEPAPQAVDLLTRLTTRWWEAHKGGDAAPPTRSATNAAALTEEPGARGQAHASRWLGGSASPTAPAGIERTAMESAPAQGTVPAVQNTIHLTVQPPPGVEAFDADELAELLGRILRREAQRHGIPLL